ncbi:hypothetical protein OnM2_062018 [Erysiphe neolycopersici]|uniref:Uncharacterized protein n=1 Tax=Erysiphe neolycopersici TaxID=212602 RepID=A0A420HP76_9PEZI|nr:hypothetical protein OnM2_062018 [Erysiphe neolycopersici]
MIQRTLSSQNDQVSSTSKHLPVRPWKKNLDSVFQGTVASRVHQLEGHSDKISPENRQNELESSRQSSYSRFGRRLAKHFSQPAQRNAKPSEETQNEVTHSYTGINKSSTGIDKQHDLVSGRKRPGSFDKKALVETLVPEIRVQDNEPTAWIDTYKIDSRSTGPTRLSHGTDTLLKEHVSVSSNNFPTAFPDLSNDDLRKLKHKEEVILRRRGSDSSISTTSTLRRRSVRDLFAHHGIKRPPGLASSVKFHDTEGQNNQDSRRYCHQCSWATKNDSIVCYNCKHYSDSQFSLTENFISSTEPTKKFESNDTTIQNRQRLELDSASFIKRSQRPRPSPIHPTEILLKGDMKLDNKNNLSRKPSHNLNTHRSTIGSSNKKEDSESANPVQFLSGTNVTKNVKNSPFFARESLGVTLPYQNNPRVASKKISCGTLQLNSTGSRNVDPKHIPLRHCFSLSKTHQNKYQIDSKNERPIRESYHQKSIADIYINPRHESLQYYPENPNPTRCVPNNKSLSTREEKAIEKSRVEIDRIVHSSSDADSFNEKEIDTSTTCDETFSERNSRTQVEEIPTAFEPTDGLGVLSRAKSVLTKRGARLARAKSISGADAKIIETNDKQVVSSSTINKDLEEQRRTGINNLLHSEKDTDFPSKSEIELSKVNITLGHQVRAAVGQEKIARSDNETKKQRRIKIARKIKQSLPKSTEQKKDNLERQILEDQSDDNSHLTGITTSEPSKQLIAGRWVDLPPINYRDNPSLWERSPDTSHMDIATQEIKGVTVTLQLEGRDDMVFRTKPMKVDFREKF